MAPRDVPAITDAGSEDTTAPRSTVTAVFAIRNLSYTKLSDSQQAMLRAVYSQSLAALAAGPQGAAALADVRLDTDEEAEDGIATRAMVVLGCPEGRSVADMEVLLVSRNCTGMLAKNVQMLLPGNPAITGELSAVLVSLVGLQAPVGEDTRAVTGGAGRTQSYGVPWRFIALLGGFGLAMGLLICGVLHCANRPAKKPRRQRLRAAEIASADRDADAEAPGNANVLPPVLSVQQPAVPAPLLQTAASTWQAQATWAGYIPVAQPCPANRVATAQPWPAYVTLAQPQAGPTNAASY